jgi:peptide/nickel transport system permease protein
MSSLSNIAWRKFKKDKLGVIGLFLIVLTTLIAVLGYSILPDSTPYSNKMNLELATQSPGFNTDVLLINKVGVEQFSFFNKMFFGQPSNFRELPISLYEVSDDTLFYLPFSESLVGQWETLVGEEYHIENRTYWFGTDTYGRDLLSRIFSGTRVSLAVGFISVFISLVIGITLGLCAGYFRGRVDEIIMWLVNVVWSIPTLLMVIAISLALGKGFWQVFVAVGLTMWVEVARVVRGQVLGVREQEYIEASKVMGYGNFRILFKHILPNVTAAVIVISAANFASAILIEAGLSFLGIGAQPPMASWGSMIKDHYAYIIMNKGYLAVFPGLAIMMLVLSFILVGNALRDALDVRS